MTKGCCYSASLKTSGSLLSFLRFARLQIFWNFVTRKRAEQSFTRWEIY